MLVAFELSMPRNNAWNLRWFGEGGSYVRIKSIRSKKVLQRLNERTAYSYSFGDGWVASVSIREVDRNEAARLRKSSLGFCGYDWMIESILIHGEIRAESVRV